MIPTVVEIRPRGEGVTCSLEGDLVVPRLIRRRGRSVDVALVAGRAMLLPGDEVRIRLIVGAGCALSLVDIGGLVVYGRSDADAHADRESQWHAHADLAADARLTWLGLPTVITAAGTLVRSLTIALAPGATATLRETLVLGRSGERGGRLHSDTDVSDAAGPILRETLAIRGDEPVVGILGSARVMDSVVAVGADAGLDAVPGTTLLDLARGGAVLRYLGDAAHDSPLSGSILAEGRVTPAAAARAASPQPHSSHVATEALPLPSPSQTP